MSNYIARREFIRVVGAAAAAWPFTARAQRASKVWRIGFIGGASRATASDVALGLQQGMRELGYIEGKDFIIEWRYADGIYERFPAIAAELVRLKVDVFVLGTQAAVRSVQQSTSTIPIVMAYSTDPVGNGLVASLAHPGGNVTGLASSHDDIIPKQIELVAAIVPNLSRVGLLTNPENPNSPPAVRSAQASAHQAGFALVPVEAQNAEELDVAWATLMKARVGAVIVIPDAFFFQQRERVVYLAISHRLPTIFANPEYAQSGGLMSYGESLFEFNRRAASFVDKIFKGASPADLPIEQPTKFLLVINRKTADALGLTIPVHLHILADQIIE